ncbi:hyaluronidase [Spiribacter halobius]|uniref:Hyaluronidase n=1 Tax=Sediminicurvatus halobius TaxID=2182432 RepID=A0A2U2MYX0_9GAMM|nr:hyaluronidase [Spiribacter halobius]
MPRLGVIEGFYGPAWRWEEREALAATLADHGYRFWHYAPKLDASLREGWREPWPAGQAEAMAAFAGRCRRLGLAFGVGLAPIGFDPAEAGTGHARLAERLGELDAVGIDELVVSFDDVADATPDPAHRQAAVTEWIAARTRARQVLVCPTYYSDDPLLDRLFGARPPDYLAALGRALDPGIGVYWAGEEICPREISPGHLEAVAERLRRRPWLWDNYPVNDGTIACEHLHLRPFTGRPATLAPQLSAHAINPALQPTLSALPALTLPWRYRAGEAFAYGRAFRDAARAVLGDSLAAALAEDLTLLEDAGRQRLGAQATGLRARYAAFDHPAAREVVRWLDGGYRPQQAAPGTA